MLTNFAWVVEGVLARSGRPQSADYKWIEENFSTVIVLDGDDEAEREHRALSLQVTVFSFPISDWQIYNPFKAVPQQQIDKILYAMNLAGPAKLVHCLHGQDRTGLAVAEYRVKYNGWKKQVAMDEALKFGYHKWPLNIGLTKTWNAFQS